MESQERIEVPKVEGRSYEVWDEVFDDATQQALISEDLEAGRTVTRLLTAIVALGVTIAIITVIVTS